MGGLKPPTLQQIWGYKANTGHIGTNHWSVVSNIDCPDGTVRLYDTLHTKKLSPSTIQIIADLVLPSGSELEIQIMDVQRQSDGLYPLVPNSRYKSWTSRDKVMVIPAVC